MGRHLSGAQLADLCDSAEQQAVAQNSHLRDCDSCTIRIQRIREGKQTMRSIREDTPPDLQWDHIATRVYWSTSSERRAMERSKTKVWQRPLLTGGALAIAASAAALMIFGRDTGEHPMATTTDNAQVSPKRIDAPSLDPAPLVPTTGLVTFMQGRVLVNAQPMTMNTPLTAGMHIVTDSTSRVVVQFDHKSAFRVGRDSELEVLRLDANQVELRIVGQVDVDIDTRLPNQQFIVHAGPQNVTVRGTIFRVEYRDDDLNVTCTRGEVTVVDRDLQQHSVAAGRRFSGVVEALSSPASEQLSKALQMPILPIWSPSTTRVVHVEAPVAQAIAIDGVRIATGPFAIRTSMGRHQVSPVQEDGTTPARGHWIDTSQPSSDKPLQVAFPNKVLPHPPVTSPETLRKRQLKRALHKSGKTTRCTRPLAKQQLMNGAYVVFDVGIHKDGTQNYLNIVQSNLNPVIQNCLRHAIDVETLPVGPAAKFQLRLSF